MIDTKILFDFFKKEKIDFFSGVPDSVLKATSSYFSKKKVKIISSQLMKVLL